MIRLAGKYLAIFILFSLPTITAGQYRFDIWTAENGLPQNTVNGILQSQDGFLWFTTNDGIVRFDGVRFKVFNKPNTKELPTSRFNVSFEDETGRLWFKSETGDLVLFQDGVFKTFTLENGLPAKGIQNLFDDGRGGILFTSNKGHFRYSDGGFLPVEIKGSKPDSRIVYFDSRGGIWLLGEDGLRRIVGDEAINYEIKQNKEFGDPSIFEDKSGNFWIGQQNNPLRRIYNNEIQEFSYKFDKTIPKFAEDIKGNLWIGTFDKIYKIGVKGVESGDVLNEEITIFAEKDGLPGGNILSVFGGREGSVWAGSVTGGLIQITP